MARSPRARKLRLDTWLPQPTGISVHRRHPEFVHGVRVVLYRDPGMPDGFRVHTAFPQP